VARQVICGNRLAIPLNCDPVLAELMQQCWEADSRKRPNFEYIHRRLKERHTQLQNEEREVSGEKQLVYQLRQGTTFYKLPYLKGQPHKRQFRVSEDLRRLKWCFLPSRNFVQRARDPVRPVFKSMFLVEVQDIRMGMRTANFRRIENVEKFRGRPAFSIITQNRTVDILCPTPEVMDQWVLGLRFLVERLRPPSLAMPRSSGDQWMIMARLRRGSFLLKFGHSGRPHERYFCVSGNMKMVFWTSGENPVKGQHKSVDLTAVREIRLLNQAGAGNAPSMPMPKLVRNRVDDLKFGFSLVNQAGQPIINFVASNKEEFDLWTEGLQMIVGYFQNPSSPPLQHAESEVHPPVYDRGDYLAFDPDAPEHMVSAVDRVRLKQQHEEEVKQQQDEADAAQRRARLAAGNGNGSGDGLEAQLSLSPLEMESFRHDSERSLRGAAGQAAALPADDKEEGFPWSPSSASSSHDGNHVTICEKDPTALPSPASSAHPEADGGGDPSFMTKVVSDLYASGAALLAFRKPSSRELDENSPTPVVVGE
jgi:hypothetical protein